ncbi:hypothetical protein J9332_45630, partial [Aquimarina celericrescens]|nr:hypothetical protein [Aquimarina celericrescens]
KYFFIDGTDIDIEQELLEASANINPSFEITERLHYFLDLPVISAKSIYYKKGTPRFFKFEVINELEIIQPKEEIDGY